MTHTVQ